MSRVLMATALALSFPIVCRAQEEGRLLTAEELGPVVERVRAGAQTFSKDPLVILLRSLSEFRRFLVRRDTLLQVLERAQIPLEGLSGRIVENIEILVRGDEMVVIRNRAAQEHTTPGGVLRIDETMRFRLQITPEGTELAELTGLSGAPFQGSPSFPMVEARFYQNAQGKRMLMMVARIAFFHYTVQLNLDTPSGQSQADAGTGSGVGILPALDAASNATEPPQ